MHINFLSLRQSGIIIIQAVAATIWAVIEHLKDVDCAKVTSRTTRVRYMPSSVRVALFRPTAVNNDDDVTHATPVPKNLT